MTVVWIIEIICAIFLIGVVVFFAYVSILEKKHKDGEHHCNRCEVSFVLTKKDNNRIIKQDGAFIICGVNNHPEKIIHDQLRLNFKNKNILVFVNQKAKILKELDLLSINKSTLFPEIDSVSDYIKSKYSN